MKSMFCILMIAGLVLAQGYVQPGDNTYFTNLSVRGVFSVPFYVAQLMRAEISGDLDVGGTATIETAFIDTLQVDGYIATDYITSDVGLIDTLWASYMVSSPIVSGVGVTCQDFNCDSSFYMNPAAWETFFAGMPSQELTFDFPATQVNPINFAYGFTGFGHVPYISFTEDDDSSNVFLQFRADSDYIGANPEIRFEWITADTLLLGDYYEFRVYHLQSDPGMEFAAVIDTFDFDIDVTVDSLFPGYYQSAWYTLAETVYYGQNLSIWRDTSDALGDIGILAFTVRLPVAP